MGIRKTGDRRQRGRVGSMKCPRGGIVLGRSTLTSFGSTEPSLARTMARPAMLKSRSNPAEDIFVQLPGRGSAVSTTTYRYARARLHRSRRRPGESHRSGSCSRASRVNKASRYVLRSWQLDCPPDAMISVSELIPLRAISLAVWPYLPPTPNGKSHDGGTVAGQEESTAAMYRG